MIYGGDDSIEPWALALWRGHVRRLAGAGPADLRLGRRVLLGSLHLVPKLVELLG